MIATVVMSTRARPSSIVVRRVERLRHPDGAGRRRRRAAHAAPVAREGRDRRGCSSSAGRPTCCSCPRRKVEAEGEREAAAERAGSRWREISTAFTVIFVGEFGDLTQIQAANFSAKTHQPLEVFLASSLALIAVSFLGAYGGRLLQRVVPLQMIRLGGGPRLRRARRLHRGPGGHRMSRRDELLAFADTVKGFMPRDEGLALYDHALDQGRATARGHLAGDRRVVRQVRRLPRRGGRGDRRRAVLARPPSRQRGEPGGLGALRRRRWSTRSTGGSTRCRAGSAPSPRPASKRTVVGLVGRVERRGRALRPAARPALHRRRPRRRGRVGRLPRPGRPRSSPADC